MGTKTENDQGHPRKLTQLLSFERCFPAAGAAIGMLFLAVVSHWRPLACRLACSDLYAATLNIAAILMGFLATILAIMFSIRDARPMRHLQQAGVFGVFKSYLVEGIVSASMLVVVSLIGLAFHQATPPVCRFEVFLFYIYSFALAYSGLSFWRVIHILHKMLKVDLR